MATITASAAYSGVQPRAGLGVCSVFGTVELTSVTANDVVQMVKIPIGASILDVKISGDGAGTIVGTVTVGDGNDADRYMPAVSVSGAMVAQGLDSIAGGLGYEYSADDTIDLTFSAVSAGSGTLTLRMQALYTLDP